MIPMPGTIKMDIPHTISEKPSINDMIAAFAHGLFLISGSSLSFMGTHVPNWLKGPPTNNPQTAINPIT